MKQVLLILATIFTLQAAAQPIAYFHWNSNPLTRAAIGSNALSVSTSAVSAAGGSAGTNGINPGLPKMNIDLTLDGAPFNVPGIDISLNFRREESEASFFRRGSLFDFGMSGGNLYATFNLVNGSSRLTISSGNVFSLPSDGRLHNYRFRYDNATGQANIWVDGVIKYTYNGTAGRPLFWTGAGNVVIGANMDGSGTNVTILDNMIVQNAANAALPQQLLSFDALAQQQTVVLNWATTKEYNMSAYEVERSSNGIDFTTIATVQPANGYSLTNKYSTTDRNPLTGKSYYRLKMVDADGKVVYSSIRMVNRSAKTAMRCYPNPATDKVTVEVPAGTYNYSVYTQTGQLLSSGRVVYTATVNQLAISLDSVMKNGVVLVKVNDEVFPIVKK